MIYLVTGWPGAGKSTVAVQHAIYRYACAGRRVVANFPIDFAPVSLRRSSSLARCAVQVIPDRPSRADLDSCGVGGEREETAGMLIVDEAGGWLNARTWQGAQRELIIDWLTQSRKRFWDVYLIAQAPAMLDKQVREAVCEGVVRIRRFDRWKILGVSMPRCHIAIVRYGMDANAPVIERWFYRGTEAQRCFGSYRVFGADSANYSVLPASQTKWRGKPVLRARSTAYVFAGIALAGLVAVGKAPAVAFIWMAVCASLGRLWGFDSLPAKRLPWVNRIRRYGEAARAAATRPDAVSKLSGSVAGTSSGRLGFCNA